MKKLKGQVKEVLKKLLPNLNQYLLNYNIINNVNYIHIIENILNILNQYIKNNTFELKDIDIFLNYINDYLEFYGIKSIESEFIYSYYYQHISFLYINTGDTYIKTFIYNVNTHKFIYNDVEFMVMYSENENNY